MNITHILSAFFGYEIYPSDGKMDTQLDQLCLWPPRPYNDVFYVNKVKTFNIETRDVEKGYRLGMFH